MNNILDFSDKSSEINIQEIGGKAHSLINMHRKNLPIPPGMVLKVSFFQPWIDALKSTEKWKLLIKMDFNSFIS